MHGSETERLMEIIASDAALSEKEMWSAIIHAGRAWKPAGYDEVQETLRHHYENTFGPLLDAAMARRYPNTGHRMPRAPIGWGRLYAENGASTFDLPPSFSLRSPVDGSEIKPSKETPEGQAALDLMKMSREAALQMNLAEAERRSVLCGDCFIRAHSDSIEAAATGKPPRTAVTLFWPNDILIIPHHQAPTSLAAAVAIIARVASDDGLSTTTTTYEVWRRSYEDTSDGLPVFGPWSMEMVTQRGRLVPSSVGEARLDYSIESKFVWEQYPYARAPWVVIRGGIPEGKPYVDPNRNLPDIFDSVNGSVMSKLFAVDMGAASVLVRQTDQVAAAKIALGAGLLVNIPRNDLLTSVPQNTDFAGINQSIRSVLGMMAITARQRVDGFDVDASSTPSSGVALRIKSEPQMKARLEAVARIIPAADELLSIMSEIHDNQRATRILEHGTPHVEPQDPPDYEDLQVTQTRAMQLYDAGLITGEKVLVAARMAPDEAVAKRMIEEAQAQKSSRRPAPPEGETEEDEPVAVGSRVAIGDIQATVESIEAGIATARTSDGETMRAPVDDLELV